MSAKVTIDSEGTVVITPTAPSATVVFLHGLGDTARGWSDTMTELSKDFSHVKFILPTASNKPVTVNMGRKMPSWFDIKQFGASDAGAEGIEDSRDRILSIIDNEVKTGIPYSRIVLGGFSQGGAVSLFTGYQIKKALAGILVLSSRIPRIESFALAPETINVPVLMCHGSADPVVRFSYAQQSKEKLEASGVHNVDFHVYEGLGHSLCQEELQDIKTWLHRTLPSL